MQQSLALHSIVRHDLRQRCQLRQRPFAARLLFALAARRRTTGRWFVFGAQLPPPTLHCLTTAQTSQTTTGCSR